MKPQESLAILALSIFVACDIPTAMGEANSLIILAPDSLWQQVEEQTYQALEPTIYTTRDEKEYVVTAIDPTDPDAEDIHPRLFRNVLVFGNADDPVLQEVADAGDLDLSTMDAPHVFQVTDVWARG